VKWYVNWKHQQQWYQRIKHEYSIDLKRARQGNHANHCRYEAHGEKISMLTAYDYTMAGIVDSSGVDVILVGDSASNVMAGYETTVPMTLEHMIYHTACVVRGVDRALVIADLPFMSYQVTTKEALISAGRMMKEAGAHAVKLEGGEPIAATVKRIVDAGIPVMGHLGLTPQSIYKFGTYKVRAKEEEEARTASEGCQNTGRGRRLFDCIGKDSIRFGKESNRIGVSSYHRHRSGL
jgi:3-methyl-2-oxobutanoate hydroxymethyltransferase